MSSFLLLEECESPFLADVDQDRNIWFKNESLTFFSMKRWKKLLILYPMKFMLGFVCSQTEISGCYNSNVGEGSCKGQARKRRLISGDYNSADLWMTFEEAVSDFGSTVSLHAPSTPSQIHTRRSLFFTRFLLPIRCSLLVTLFPSQEGPRVSNL